MLYCSDCDKDVEFKSLDVGGKLTHCCVECGSTNLFRSKEVYEAGVEFVVETAKKIEEEKIKEAKEIDIREKEAYNKSIERQDKIVKALAIISVVIAVLLCLFAFVAV